jgi:O-antigen/teichoic acid export membrane protein
MAKTNYIAEMDESTRKLAIIVLVPATLISGACFFIALATAILFLPEKPNAPIGSFVACILIFGFLAFSTCWMAIRLIKQERASNGRTVMPESFIQIFGFLFLVGILTMAILDRNIWLAGEGIGIAFAMIGIRTLIRRAQSPSTNA